MKIPVKSWGAWMTSARGWHRWPVQQHGRDDQCLQLYT